MTLPFWRAMIVHLPVARVRMVDPDTVHTRGVVEVKDTGSREDADADKVTGSPTSTPCFTSGDSVKVIRCPLSPVFTGNHCSASAGAKVALPPWEAVIVHTPAATARAVDPDTVHTAGVLDVSDTGSPESGADANKATRTPADTPRCTTSGGSVRVVVCVFWPVVTWNDR